MPQRMSRLGALSLFAASMDEGVQPTVVQPEAIVLQGAAFAYGRVVRNLREFPEVRGAAHRVSALLNDQDAKNNEIAKSCLDTRCCATAPPFVC